MGKKVALDATPAREVSVQCIQEEQLKAIGVNENLLAFTDHGGSEARDLNTLGTSP